MANLSTFGMIHERVRKYRSDFDLDSDSLAFDCLALETVLGLGEDDIQDALTEGMMDGGIDAIYIADKIVHIFNFKYTDRFELSKKNFPEIEVDKVSTTMSSILDKSLTKKDVNEVLWDKVQEIWELLEKVGSLTFRFYFCSNKEVLVEHARRRFERNMKPFKLVEFNYIDQEEFASKILEKKFRKVNGQVKFIEKQYFDRSDGRLKGVVANVAATDLIKLVSTEAGGINEEAFNDNVRLFLALRNRINEGIYETALSNDNYEFWYLNNGITIVCETCDYTPSRSPLVTLTNFQIVNGGQTTHALFEAYQADPERVDDVLVLIRICVTNDNKISERIGETTNSQTPVRTRDLHANDRIQKKIEDEFYSLGYFYERKRNQYSQEVKKLRLDNELLGQIYLAYYLDMPTEAKNQRFRVFDDKYDEIFDEESISARKMLEPYLVYLPIEDRKKEIQRKKRKKEMITPTEVFTAFATFHILNGVKYVAEYADLDLTDGKELDEAIKICIKHIGQVVKTQKAKRGERYSHDTFFKQVETNKLIRNHIQKAYGVEPT